MEDNENTWPISHEYDTSADLANELPVPSTLLPTVLERLGLSSEQAEPAVSVDGLMAMLKSDDWQLRAAAVRTLGRMESGAPVEILSLVLDDKDSSVRAAAVRSLANVGKRAPLPRLVAALQDADWHVRETAVFALADQGQRVSDAIFKGALNDEDSSVQEAARMTMQARSEKHARSIAYGRLLEKKNMQPEQSTPSTANGYAGSDASKTISDDNPKIYYEAWQNNEEPDSDSDMAHAGQEQMQEYAPTEYVPPSSVHGEKVTMFSSRRRPVRRPWGIIAVFALVFFLIGGSLTYWMAPHLKSPLEPSSRVVGSGKLPQPAPILPDLPGLMGPQYAAMFQKELSSGLKLSPDQIRMQMKMGKSLTDIAASQGITASQLGDLELSAFKDMLSSALKSGAITGNSVDKFMQKLQNNPGMREKLSEMLMMFDTSSSAANASSN